MLTEALSCLSALAATSILLSLLTPELALPASVLLGSSCAALASVIPGLGRPLTRNVVLATAGGGTIAVSVWLLRLFDTEGGGDQLPLAYAGWLVSYFAVSAVATLLTVGAMRFLRRD